MARSASRKCQECEKPLDRGTTGALCRDHYTAARKAATAPPEGLQWTVKPGRADVSYVGPERVRSLADLKRVCEIDTNEWRIKEHTINKWEVGAKLKRANGTEEMTVTPLWQVKAVLVPNTLALTARAEIAALVADAKRQLPARALPEGVVYAPGDCMLEVNIPDLHLGKLAWSKETGYASYDTREAEREFLNATEYALTSTIGYPLDHIVFVIGNDFFNADNKANTTTHGTPQDSDSRHQRTFLHGRRMVQRAIELCRQRAPVVGKIVPGNHDEQAAWYLGDSLEAYFHRTEGVTIDNAPTMRKYHEFGRNMLMWTHGNKGKLADYPLLMATEQREMFGRTVFREAHTGDKHHLRVHEFHGVRVRISPALCAPDAWHSINHYVGALRSAETFVWHRTKGHIATTVYTVDPDEGKHNNG